MTLTFGEFRKLTVFNWIKPLDSNSGSHLTKKAAIFYLQNFFKKNKPAKSSKTKATVIIWTTIVMKFSFTRAA